MIGELVMYDSLAVPLFLLASGAALAFFGSRLVPFAIAICAVILGLVHGGGLLLYFSENADVLRYGPIVVAILFAIIVSFLYRAAFFLAGLFIGYFAVTTLFPQITPLIAIIVAIICGALVYASRNFVFSVLTALMGAGLFATGTVNALAWVNISAGVTSYWLTVVITFIAGIVYQVKRNKGRK